MYDFISLGAIELINYGYNCLLEWCKTQLKVDNSKNGVYNNIEKENFTTHYIDFSGPDPDIKIEPLGEIKNNKLYARRKARFLKSKNV